MKEHKSPSASVYVPPPPPLFCQNLSLWASLFVGSVPTPTRSPECVSVHAVTINTSEVMIHKATFRGGASVYWRYKHEQEGCGWIR